MNKKSFSDDHVLRDFYRPHARVQYTGELVDPVTGEFFTPPRMVKQSFVAECDINTIMKQYSLTGQIKHISANAEKGAYMDLPDDIDYQASLQIVKNGQDAFASLPAKTRDRFHNSPQEFLEFLANPENKAEAAALGLTVSQAPAKAPDPVTAPAPEPSPQKA